MRKKSYLKILPFLLLLFILTFNLFALASDDITPLVAGDYFLKVHRELQNADESIYIKMYLMRLESDDFTNQLISDLIDADKKGVKVEVVLEDAFKSDKNKNAYERLKEAGVKVNWDLPDKVTHSKLIVIDKEKVILGSYNWTYHSLRLNNEAGILIDSKEIAKAILDESLKEKEPDIDILDENRYFDGVIKAINNARDSIVIVMYEYGLNPKRGFSPPKRIADALIEAKQRGVKINIILDQNFIRRENRFGNMQTGIERKNITASEFLKSRDVEVLFDRPDRITHDKLIVIDKKITIVGSQNWTRQSQESEQVSVLIRNEAVAKEFLRAIGQIKTADSKIEDKAYDDAYSIRLPYEFFYKIVSDKPIEYKKTIGSLLFTNQAHYAMDLYLLLLWEWDGNPQAKIKLNYERLTGELTAEKIEAQDDKLRPYPFTYYRLVKRVLRDLDKKYHLLTYNEKEDYAQLLNCGASKRYISIPYAFWDYGWAKRLSMRAKYMYFISLLERQRSTVKPWWFDSQERLSDRYKISVGSIEGGLLELQRYNLIEIYRFSPDEGQPYSHRWSNNYYLNELRSEDEVNENWQRLRNKYGRRNLDRAKRLAEQLNDPQDAQVVIRFIQLIERYGWKKVRRANDITAKLRVENPKRHIGYTISILKNWQAED